MIFQLCSTFLILFGFVCSDVVIENQLNLRVPLANNLIVSLPNGLVQGKDNGFYYSYESIPYAEPPIGQRRFEPPEFYTKQWGTLDASKEPVKCMQWDQYQMGDDKLQGEEDCLTVNIYKPNSEISKKLPVIALVHGGAFMFGSVSANKIDLMMRSGRVIVVKMTYRLGPLGFLSTEDEAISGNFGLKDIRLALQWIKLHIEAFGGDPDKITVMGFSAGSAAVHLQMLKEDLSDYATAAVSMSGTALNPWVIMRNPRLRAVKLAKYLKCPNVESAFAIKKCLQSIPAEQIVSAVQQFLTFGYNPFTTFGPVIESAKAEDAFLTEEPEELILAGKYAKIPWLVSYTAQDGAYNAAELLTKSKNGKELMEELNERWLELAPQKFFFDNLYENETIMNSYSLTLKQNYFGDNKLSTDSYNIVQKMHTDILFKNGTERAVSIHSENGDISVFAFIYDNPADFGIGHLLSGISNFSFGTAHGDDYSLIFPIPSRKSVRPDEQTISEKFLKMLQDFAENRIAVGFGNCRFINNAGLNQPKFMKIKNNKCKNFLI